MPKQVLVKIADLMEARRHGKQSQHMKLPELSLSGIERSDGKWPLYINVKRFNILGFLESEVTFESTDLINMRSFEDTFAQSVQILTKLDVPFSVTE